MEHSVVLGDEMEPSAGTRHALELGDDLVGMRDRVEHMPACREVERSIRQAQLEDAPVLESEPRSELGVAVPRELEMIVENVDAENFRLRVELGETRSALARAAPGVQDVDAG
jgi:hypothetical protein